MRRLSKTMNVAPKHIRCLREQEARRWIIPCILVVSRNLSVVSAGDLVPPISKSFPMVDRENLTAEMDSEQLPIGGQDPTGAGGRDVAET